MAALKFVVAIGKLTAGLGIAITVAGFAPPATAATPIVLNGNFVGAKNLAGTTLATPFSFGSHTYLTNFGWSNSGSGALSWIAGNGAQVINQSGGTPGFSPLNPVGYTGNVYVADASPRYAPGTYLLQTLNGLTVGTDYRISFLQAAGNYYVQTDPSIAYTDTARWLVGLGGGTAANVSRTRLLGTDVVQKLSPEMKISPAKGTSPWELVTLTFTARKTSDLLSFYASGSGAPPFALLADVRVSAVPEPSSWAMMIVGMGAVGYSLRRRRARLTAVTA